MKAKKNFMKSNDCFTFYLDLGQNFFFKIRNFQINHICQAAKSLSNMNCF